MRALEQRGCTVLAAPRSRSGRVALEDGLCRLKDRPERKGVWTVWTTEPGDTSWK